MKIELKKEILAILNVSNHLKFDNLQLQIIIVYQIVLV